MSHQTPPRAMHARGATPVMAKSKKPEAETRRDDLDRALEQITKDFGKGAVMRLGDPGAAIQVSSIPTGALSLDIALGIGGIPRGRIT